MERETRFELATLALARRCSTTELLPLVTSSSISGGPKAVKPQRLFSPREETRQTARKSRQVLPPGGR